VNLHPLKFDLGKLVGLGNDVLWNGQLPDVMEQRRGMQRLKFGTGQSHATGGFGGVDADPAQVTMLGGIVAFNRE